MNFSRIDQLAELGFDGGIRTAELLRSSCRDVPEQPGVYLIVRNDERPIAFLDASSGGRFKGQDPSVPIDRLTDRWVEDSRVLYIGKAGGSTVRTTLRDRLLSYMRFGGGRGCSHWGGRLIWQVAGAEELLVYWKQTSGLEPRELEKALLEQFLETYRRLPFANLRR